MNVYLLNWKVILLAAGLGILGFCLLPSGSFAASNPSADYCKAMGYTFSTQKSDSGSVGYCTLPDGSQVNAWDFFRGKTGTEYSYCAQKGYSMTTRTVTTDGYQAEEPVCIPPSSSSGKQSGSSKPMMDMLKEDGMLQTPSRYNNPQSDGDATLKTRKSSTKTSSYPSSFDWRSYNGHSYIGAVRDQGDCGGCYAFGAVAAAEGAYNHVNRKFDSNAVNFSESYLMWCLGTYGSYSSHFSGCDGADYEYQELAALTNEGVTWEENFPFTETDPGKCTHSSDPTVVFNSWGRAASNDEDAIKEAISTYGVVDAAVYVDNSFYFYSGGIYKNSNTSCPDGAYTYTDHAVSLVGWGTDTTYGTYWILRNSWGSDWGEDGYMRIQAQSAAVGCSVAYVEAIRDASAVTGTAIVPVYELLLK